MLSVGVLVAWGTCVIGGAWYGPLPELTLLLWVVLAAGEAGAIAVGLVHYATADGRYGVWIAQRLAALVGLLLGAVVPPALVMALFGR